MKIAIILNEMHIGGIPRACVPLMQQLLKYAEVTLILSNTSGELHSQIPEGVKELILPYRRTKAIIKKYLTERRYLSAIAYIVQSSIYGKLSKRWVKANVYDACQLGYIVDQEFDCAIAFHGMNIDQLARTLYNINARKKIAWIHGDHPFVGKHMSDVAAIYKKYDRILCDSEICKEKFLKDFPFLAAKMETFYCLLNINEIIRKSSESNQLEFDSNYINILTVGRLSPEKGQDMIPEILSILHRPDIRWYLIGDGPDRERLRALQKDFDSQNLIFLGSKTNPYPYIKDCDIYVQPSYSEAYSITAFEAATFGKPIVITDVAGATELLRSGVDSIVVQPSPTSIAQGVSMLLNDETLLNKLKMNISEKDFSNYNEINKLINYIV